MDREKQNNVDYLVKYLNKIIKKSNKDYDSSNSKIIQKNNNNIYLFSKTFMEMINKN